MARKKKATLDLPNIKMKDGKKSKANKPEQLDIDSPENDDGNVVDQAISIARQIDNLQTSLALLEDEVKDAASDAKVEEASNDRFVKTVNVKGSELKVQIQFRDAFSAMDLTMAEPLQAIFGDKYPILFKTVRTDTIREEKLDELKELLGDRYEDFVAVDESLKAAKGFQQAAFDLRKGLSPEQNATIEKVLEACQSKPAVKYPKA